MSTPAAKAAPTEYRRNDSLAIVILNEMKDLEDIENTDSSSQAPLNDKIESHDSR